MRFLKRSRLRRQAAELICNLRAMPHNSQLNAACLNLDGEWRFALDASDSGLQKAPGNWKFPDKIQLPGILTAQGFGEVPSIRTQWTGKGWDQRELFREWQDDANFKMPFFLTPPRHYVGPAWYQREIDIPESWAERDVILFLERVHWQSMIWIDGEMQGSADALATPHIFHLASLKPGTRTLTLRIDNRIDEINPGPLAHSVTDHTQGNWNGVVGKMTLEALPASHIDSIKIFPKNDGTVRLEINGFAAKPCHLIATAAAVENTSATPYPFNENLHIEAGIFQKVITGRFDGMPLQLWSEFHAPLYQLRASLVDGKEVRLHSHEENFGFREIENRDGILHLNGRRAFMRGTLECAIFPRLGHPPTDVAAWKRIIRICKNYGLNHMRFHSWCPPQAAFVAADELGFYLQPEASASANDGAQIGSGLPIDAWVDAETDRILASYGNHPSFLFMAYGNEPAGPEHSTWLAAWVKRQQEKDPRRLYTTAAGWPVLEGSDFHLTFKPRIQRWGEGLDSIINAQPPATDFDWRNCVNEHCDAPIISHEIGQWCVYPNFREIEKYDGYFKAKNFEIFRETAERHGILDQANDFLTASGKWQVAAYKHDIEAAMRTPHFGGFQLLDLHDFPGQGTALVGVLDAFWDAKSYISAEEFRRFSGPIVPLARMEKMVFLSYETLTAELELFHFGPDTLFDLEPTWQLTNGDVTIAAGTLPKRSLEPGDVHPLGTIQVSLHDVAAPAKLALTVGATSQAFSNSWDVFIYPSKTPEAADVLITTTLDETLQALSEGRNVLWLAAPETVADDPALPIQIGFSPIFWNTTYTEWQPPHTLGLLNRNDHPALADFPTDTHTNWQWWEIVSQSRPFILTPHHSLKPIVQPIDDWVTNRKLALVFEATVGKGKLLACSADLTHQLDQRPAARQLRASLQNYVASPHFQPADSLKPNDLKAIVVSSAR
jgi:hypothetical protein